MGTPLGPKYIPYTYMDPLGVQTQKRGLQLGLETYQAQTPRQPWNSNSLPWPQKVCKVMAFLGYYYGFRAIILHSFGV